ncbi:chemotaxis protein CheX [Thermaerobacillus caldiproteolyticus]|uniref:Chemotaxis protein CheX n=1 Tax=Thermaerobacillus caldiproteolyticus TaxID=247480 RepID=A0A7V9Z594_9BACL|nr:chemotaxis protein CheX [Anoxybacillus caldiproteolyticus]MBA2874267.1 chemotaxis protein CheX [Anoxybacillus caldiproteolyticus]
MTATTTTITHILNSAIESIKTVIPTGVEIQKPTLYNTHSIQSSLSVLIGMTGQIQGQLVIGGTSNLFAQISELMYGMTLEGDMLESFTCELGNMIAGHLVTYASKREMTMDITPPTLLIGEASMKGFQKAILVPVTIAEKGTLHVIVTLHD